MTARTCPCGVSISARNKSGKCRTCHGAEGGRRLQAWKRREVAWTFTETAILAAHYPTMGARVTSLLPGRSELAVISRASQIGVRKLVRSDPDAWTAEEIALLTEWYPKGGAKACAEHINRSIQSIRVKAFKAGVRRKAPKPAQIRLPRLTFEEQLARVASGQVGLRQSLHLPYRATSDDRSLAGACPL